MLDPRSVLQTAGRYLRSHPDEIRRALRNALGLRLGLPLDAFRWLASELMRGEAPMELELESRPPGIFVAGNVELAGSLVRASAVLFIDRVVIDETQIRFELRVESMQLVPLEGKKSPLNALLRATMLDLSRPGDLIEHLPGIPDVIVEAHDNRLIIDLAKVPRIAEDPRLRQIVGFLSALVTVDAVQSDEAHLDLRFRPIPRGVSSAIEAVDELIVRPAVARVDRELTARVPGLRRRLSARVHRVMGVFGVHSADS